jgi:type VII secretion protein eccB
MPSNKEILEAQRYNRRRLITAFTSGIPGGRELESKSPFVPLIVGSVVVAIMLGVGVVISRFAPTLPQDWQNSTLIMVKGTGARYYTINGVLRPVTNITSARLVSESGKYQTSEVPASTIEGISRGSQFGITGVPDDVPPANQLHSDQWFSCDMSGTPHTWVAQVPATRTSRGNALVTTQDGELFLIANGRRHKIPAGQTPNPVSALGLDSVTPVAVSLQWLSLFEPGSDLKFLEVEGAGRPVTGMPESINAAVIGSVIEVQNGDSIQRYVVTGNKKAIRLTNLAEKLYRMKAPLSATLEDMAKVDIDTSGITPADWPESINGTMPTGSVPCAQLAKTADGSSAPTLYSMTSQAITESLPKAPSGNATGADKSQSQTPPIPTSVRGGSGALIRSTTSGGNLGVVMLVSDLGTIHGIGSPATDTLARLGYSEGDVQDIPAAWTALIPEGQALDPASVWETVKQQ